MAGMDGGVIRAPKCPHYAARPHRATLSLTACDVLLPPPPLLPLYFSLMPARYAPLPNPHTDPDAINEMEAAFDDSDDDDDGPQPLTARGRNGYQALSNAEPEHPTRDSHDVGHHQGAAAPGAYDFENADFDYIRPPPGSPPRAIRAGPPERVRELERARAGVPGVGDGCGAVVVVARRERVVQADGAGGAADALRAAARLGGRAAAGPGRRRVLQRRCVRQCDGETFERDTGAGWCVCISGVMLSIYADLCLVCSL